MLYLELAQEALVDFGLFYYCQGRGVPHDQAYTEMLDQIVLAEALGKDWKGKLSPVFYLLAIPLAFVSSWISIALYASVALLWLVPDKRIERALQHTNHVFSGS